MSGCADSNLVSKVVPERGKPSTTNLSISISLCHFVMFDGQSLTLAICLLLTSIHRPVVGKLLCTILYTVIFI
jgi:hypothetical protein